MTARREPPARPDPSPPASWPPGPRRPDPRDPEPRRPGRTPRIPRERLNLSAGLASIAVAVTLVALKGWALLATGALSVAASLVDSLVDLIASSAALLGILYAARPPDDDHTFGHNSIEDLVALGQAALVTASAGAIGWQAVGRLREPQALSAEAAGLGVMLAATGLTLALVLWQGHVARRTGSRIVAADRLHYLSDLLPNLGAILALLAAGAGILWLDPVTALLACVVLLWGARRIGSAAWHALMDRQADPALVRRIAGIVAAHPGLAGFHDLRTRTAGSRLFIQVHIELDGAQSLREAHAVGAALRKKLLKAFPDADVIIHKDPV
jgi:ferrous-iron efflux pump FieF